MLSASTWLDRSDVLHSRVQAYIRAAEPNRETFEALALDIGRFQAEFIPGFARLVDARRSALDTVASIPAVPVDAFRLTRIAIHPAEVDAVCYHTSGTTSGQPGLHFMRRLDTYRTAAITWARAGLLRPGSNHAVVVALLPEGTAETSSLSAMAAMFMHEFDDAPEHPGVAAMPSRWLLGERGVDTSALSAHLERAKAQQRPFVVVATAIALARLLEDLGDAHLPSWPETVIMPTGGFKGKIREIATPELRQRVAAAFGIRDESIVGEYGMTELSSQLYEGCLPGGVLASRPGYFVAPPWLEVCPVDPETLAPVAPGEIGIARFVDIANVDSAVCIVTQDLVRETPWGFELLGRRPGAIPRGCSLGTEEFLRGTRA